MTEETLNLFIEQEEKRQYIEEAEKLNITVEYYILEFLN